MWLWDNSVKINADVSIVVTPWYYSLFKDRLRELYTNNEELIEKGIVGMYKDAAGTDRIENGSLVTNAAMQAAEKRTEAAVAGLKAQRPEIERRYDAQARQNDQGYMLFYRKKREGEARMWRGKEEEKKRKRREKTGKTRWGGK